MKNNLANFAVTQKILVPQLQENSCDKSGIGFLDQDFQERQQTFHSFSRDDALDHRQAVAMKNLLIGFSLRDDSHHIDIVAALELREAIRADNRAIEIDL